jgi:acyl carrier protein
MSETTRFERNAIKESMASILRLPVARFGDEESLTSLVPSSFALVELVIRLQEDYRVRLVQEDLRIVKSVGDLLGVLEERITRQHGG